MVLPKSLLSGLEIFPSHHHLSHEKYINQNLEECQNENEKNITATYKFLLNFFLENKLKYFSPIENLLQIWQNKKMH